MAVRKDLSLTQQTPLISEHSCLSEFRRDRGL